MAAPQRREVAGPAAAAPPEARSAAGAAEEEAASLPEILATPAIWGAEAVAVAEPDPTIRIRP